MTDKTSQTHSLNVVPYTLLQLIMYFLRLGTLGFGGPVAFAYLKYRYF